MPDINLQHSPVPAPRGPLSAGSDIVIRTMASDIASVVKGGGLPSSRASGAYAGETLPETSLPGLAEAERVAAHVSLPAPSQISGGNLGGPAATEMPGPPRPDVNLSNPPAATTPNYSTGSSAGGPTGQSSFWVWILIVLAGAGFLALAGYIVYRFLG